jgi:hypothetical protein
VPPIFYYTAKEWTLYFPFTFFSFSIRLAHINVLNKAVFNAGKIPFDYDLHYKKADNFN